MDVSNPFKGPARVLISEIIVQSHGKMAVPLVNCLRPMPTPRMC
jgi:hypothetical protein